MPIGYFAAVMGLVGLGLAARAAAPLFPGVFRAPAYFTEPWIAAGTLALLLFLFLYLLKMIGKPEEARADFTLPERMGPLGCIPVGLMLIAAGLAPYAPEAATPVWWIGVAAWAAALVLGLVRLVQLGFPLRCITPSWLVLLAGALVAPAGGLPLGQAEVSRWAFSIGTAAALALMVPLALRARLGPPLPEAQRYAWFIPIAPLSLIAVQGHAAFRHPGFVVALYLALLAAACVAWYARGILRWPFSEAVWSITFPLDSLALATARHALGEQSAAWRAVAALALLLATLAVLFSLYKTVASLAMGRTDARVR